MSCVPNRSSRAAFTYIFPFRAESSYISFLFQSLNVNTLNKSFKTLITLIQFVTKFSILVWKFLKGILLLLYIPLIVLWEKVILLEFVKVTSKCKNQSHFIKLKHNFFMFSDIIFGSSTLLIARKSGHVICPKSEEEEESLVVNAGPDLHRMRQSSSEKKIIATGGIENPLKLFDIEHKKQLFIAKNVKPDSLQLRVPVWVSDIGFLHGSSKLVTTSKYGHVRYFLI